MSTKGFTLPLMTVDEERNQLPECFCSATFTCVNDKFYMVTAAHALITMDEKPIYIATSNCPPISLKGHITARNNTIDLAVTRISDAIVSKVFEECLFVTSELVHNPYPEDRDHICEIIGYPANKI
jgi:hypothetical protein